MKRITKHLCIWREHLRLNKEDRLFVEGCRELAGESLELAELSMGAYFEALELYEDFLRGQTIKSDDSKR